MSTETERQWEPTDPPKLADYEESLKDWVNDEIHAAFKYSIDDYGNLMLLKNSEDAAPRLVFFADYWKPDGGDYYTYSAALKPIIDYYLEEIEDPDEMEQAAIYFENTAKSARAILAELEARPPEEAEL